MSKRHTIILMLTLMLLASALTCLILTFLGNPLLAIVSRDDSRISRDMDELLSVIHRLYIGDINDDELSTAAMRAVVEALDDRWSYYMTADEYMQYVISTRNQFAGIGVNVIIDEQSGGMLVMSTHRGSPADIAGVLAGDVITEVDGASIAGFTLDEIRAVLARPYGETAQITVVRENGNIEYLIVAYELIFSDPISYSFVADGIGYIRIANFEGSSASGFIAAVDDLIEQGANALIFDVRGNGGGRVNEMTRMLDYLLPEGEIFVSVDRDEIEDIIWSDADMVDIPAAVLVDRYSFSAAEYFAAILMEYDYAIIVGEQTTGKSRSQRTEILSNGGALHISTSQYLTRNRVALFDVGGLTPDYLLTLSDEDFGSLISGRLDIQDDPQIALAISMLVY